MISVYYNNIVLKDCIVKRFQQTVVRDESDTDVMYSRFIVTVEATLVESQYQDTPLGVDPNALPNSFVSVPVQGQDVVDGFDQVTRALSENRKDFWMTCGGQTPGVEAEDFEDTLLIAAGSDPGPGGDINIYRHPRFAGQGSTSRFQVIDVENGPNVDDVAIEQVYGGTSMRVSATFKIARSLCIEHEDEKPIDDWTLLPDDVPGTILNNRWSISETKDANWVTQRTISGTLRTRHADYFSQDFRSAVFPPLMKGYRRISQRFVSDPTNTVLKYEIVDSQEYAAPPPPAIAWNATQTESTTGNGAIQAANFTIQLTGTQGVDKKELIEAAGHVLSLRIKDIQNEPGGADFSTTLKEMSVMDRLEVPVIEMRASVLYTTTEDTWLSMRVKDMMGGRGGNLTGPGGIDGYDPTVWPKPLAYDSETPAGLLACYLQNPCSQWHGTAGVQQYDVYRNDRPVEIPTYPPDTWEYPEPKELKIDTRTWGNTSGTVEDKYDIQRFPYTHYTFATSWETSHGRMHMPYSNPTAEEEPEATFILVNRGVTRLFYEIEAVRTGMYPLIPELKGSMTDDNEINYELLEHTITMRPPEITADGNTKRYGIAIRLVYGADTRLAFNSTLNPGALPIDLTPASSDHASIALDSITDDQNKLIDDNGGGAAE